MNPADPSARRLRAFTLIELLVVIAIIGILTSVVLVSVNTARDRASDAAVQSNLASARAEAEIYLASQTPASYVGICASTGTTTIGDNLLAAGSAGSGSVSCNATDTEWAAWANLRSEPTEWWCVDASGRAIPLTAEPAVGATRCD